VTGALLAGQRPALVGTHPLLHRHLGTPYLYRSMLNIIPAVRLRHSLLSPSFTPSIILFCIGLAVIASSRGPRSVQLAACGPTAP
jgi:hypothetical protein